MSTGHGEGGKRRCAILLRRRPLPPHSYIRLPSFLLHFFPWLDGGNGKMVFSPFPSLLAQTFQLMPPPLSPFSLLSFVYSLPLLSPSPFPLDTPRPRPSFIPSPFLRLFFFLAPIFPPSSWAEIDNCLASLPFFSMFRISLVNPHAIYRRFYPLCQVHRVSRQLKLLLLLC